VSTVSTVTDTTTFPPVFYVPCAQVPDEDAELRVDLRRTRDGRVALLVYSALDRLVSCCGAEQPWPVLRTSDLEKVRLETGYDLVLLDMDVPPEFRHTAGPHA
jgi:hypothetical protein